MDYVSGAAEGHIPILWQTFALTSPWNLLGGKLNKGWKI